MTDINPILIESTINTDILSNINAFKDWCIRRLQGTTNYSIDTGSSVYSFNIHSLHGSSTKNYNRKNQLNSRSVSVRSTGTLSIKNNVDNTVDVFNIAITNTYRMGKYLLSVSEEIYLSSTDTRLFINPIQYQIHYNDIPESIPVIENGIIEIP